MTRWVQINRDGFGSEHNRSVRAMAILDRYLYAATYNPVDGSEIWRARAYEPNMWDTWRNVSPDWSRDIIDVRSMVIFNDELYVGTVRSQIWKTGRGLLWSQVTPDAREWIRSGEISSMIVKDDVLYIAKSEPAQIWRNRSGDWEVLVSDGFGDPDNNDSAVLTVFEDTLYAGTRYQLGEGGDGCQIWYSDEGDEWTELGLPGGDGFGDPSNVSVLSLAAFEGFLYVGTLNHHGAQIWRCRRHEGEDEWRDITPVWHIAPPDEDPGWFGFINPRIQSFGVLDPHLGIITGDLYAGEGNPVPLDLGARVLVLGGGTDRPRWDYISLPGFNGNPYNRFIEVLLGSYLFVFASTYNGHSGAEIWRLGPDFDRFRTGEIPEPADYSISLILEAAQNAMPDGRPLLSWTEARRMLRNAGWDLDPDENFDAITKKRKP